MLYRPCRIIVLALLLLAPSHPASAASFSLPDDAVIEIRNFTFPATPEISPEHRLPASFHSQLAFALQKAGLSVHHGESAAVPKTEENAAAPQDGNNAPLIVTPLKEEPEKGGSAPDASLPTPADDEAENAAEDEKTPPETPPAAPPASAHNGAPTHILEGRVTLFRETLGAPSRIAGSIRIRAESQLHCAYTVKDAVTGKVLIADVSSGSAARVTGESPDYDAVLKRLSSRAMATAAETIAAQLSGKDNPGDGAMSGRNYYQDSPGKQLKSKK